jgi:type IV secretory pathway VirJ component
MKRLAASLLLLSASAQPVRCAFAEPLKDLPLVEVAAPEKGASPAKGFFVVPYSGDGGWARIDKLLAARLADRGIPVVGVNVLKYFWQAKTPETCARDLERILDHYSAEWRAQRVLLVGFSFGAEVLPVIVNRLSPGARARVTSVVLLSPGPTADFVFHVSDWLEDKTYPDSVLVVPELEKLGLPALCVYGLTEKDEVCTRAKGVRPLGLPGGHHLNMDAGAVVRAALEEPSPR